MKKPLEGGFWCFLVARAGIEPEPRIRTSSF